MYICSRLLHLISSWIHLLKYMYVTDSKIHSYAYMYAHSTIWLVICGVLVDMKFPPVKVLCVSRSSNTCMDAIRQGVTIAIAHQF